MNPLGAKLKSLRKHKDLTQQQLADVLGITVRAYQHYETGSRIPNLKKASELASVLGVSLDELSVRDCNTDSGIESA